MSYFLYSLAAFAVSVLAGTGVGGGGLFILYLVSVLGTPQTDAQAVNLVFFISAAIAALPYHIKKRRMDLRVILICIVFASVGTVLGTLLRQRLPEDAIRSAFGWLLVISGSITLLRRKKRPSENGRSLK